MSILEVIYCTLVDVEHIKVCIAIQLQCTSSSLIEITILTAVRPYYSTIQNQRTRIIDSTTILAKHNRMRGCHA
ncbi:Uncharacterised protein [Segatella copri]|nr:Uncharacterised protein [Segatella copri]